MKNKKLEANIIIVINNMRKIMDMFLGPFLTAYFIKTSKDSINSISIYYIFSYIILALVTYFVASIIKNKFRIGMFRIGVILNFIYILVIIFLKERIVDYLPLISFLYGLSAAIYWFPYNLFVINKVDNSNRTRFTVKLQIISSITGIVCPFILGSLISITNYHLTAIIVLIISLIQIILSFLLTKDEKSDYDNFNIKRTFNIIKKNNQIRNMSKVELLIGMNQSGALDTLKTILIFNSFKTNMNLGIITSIATIISMIFIRLYGKLYKNKNDKNIIMLSGLLPLIASLILIMYKSSLTIIIYTIIYVTFTSILSLTREIRLYNIADSYIVDKNNQCEYFVIREFYLNLGRIIGFILLLIAGLINTELSLYIVMIILTFTILLMANNLKKIDKFEKDKLAQKEQVY